MYASIFADTYHLKSCNITSPNIGVIRISCDIPHQILVIVRHMYSYYYYTSVNGSSPLTVNGLDPGETYSITVKVYDGNQVGLTDQIVTENITVKGYGRIFFYNIMSFIVAISCIRICCS